MIFRVLRDASIRKIVHLVTIRAEWIRSVENLNTHQNHWNIIELLYLQTESCFMQSIESTNGKLERKMEIS